MREFIVNVTRQGRVTIPVDVRKHLGVSEGGMLAFVIDEDGDVHVEPLAFPNIDTIVGIAGTLDESLSWDECAGLRARSTCRGSSVFGMKNPVIDYVTTNLDRGDIIIVAGIEHDSSTVPYSYDRHFDRFPDIERRGP